MKILNPQLVLGVALGAALSIPSGNLRADFFQDDLYFNGTGSVADANSNGDGTFTGRQVAQNFTNVDFDPTLEKALKLTWWGRVSDPDIDRNFFRVDFMRDIAGAPSNEYADTHSTRLSLSGVNFQRFTETNLGIQDSGLYLMQYETYFNAQTLADFLDSGNQYWVSITERQEDTGPWPSSDVDPWLWAGAQTDQLAGVDFYRNPALAFGGAGGWFPDTDGESAVRAFTMEEVAAVPEPGSWVLMSVMAGFAGYRRRKRQSVLAG